MRKRWLWPIGSGLLGALFLGALYFGLVSLAESSQHAAELFIDDWWIVIPLIVGFGVQVGLYVILKKRLLFPIIATGPSGKLVGAGGTTSTAAMVACCAHHITDVLPVLGLSAAATFLANYRIPFMLLGLGTTLFGIGYMLVLLLKERQKALAMIAAALEAG